MMQQCKSVCICNSGERGVHLHAGHGGSRHCPAMLHHQAPEHPHDNHELVLGLIIEHSKSWQHAALTSEHAYLGSRHYSIS